MDRKGLLRKMMFSDRAGETACSCKLADQIFRKIWEIIVGVRNLH